MNSCFEEIVVSLRIKSDGLDRIVAQKEYCTLSNSIKISQKDVVFVFILPSLQILR